MLNGVLISWEDSSTNARHKCRLVRTAVVVSMRGRDWKHTIFIDRKQVFMFFPCIILQRFIWLHGGARQCANKAFIPICLEVHLGITCYVQPTTFHYVVGITWLVGNPRPGLEICQVPCALLIVPIWLTKPLSHHGDMLFHVTSWVMHEDGERSHATCHVAISNFLGMHQSCPRSILHGSSACALHDPFIQSFRGWLQTGGISCVCSPIIKFNICPVKHNITETIWYLNECNKSMLPRLINCKANKHKKISCWAFADKFIGC